MLIKLSISINFSINLKMLKDINQPLLNQVYEGGLNESAD